jgi:hypothetical protein
MISVPVGDPHAAMGSLAAQMNAVGSLAAQMNAALADLEARVALLESIAPKKAMEKAAADAEKDDKA